MPTLRGFTRERSFRCFDRAPSRAAGAVHTQKLGSSTSLWGLSYIDPVATNSDGWGFAIQASNTGRCGDLLLSLQ